MSTVTKKPAAKKTASGPSYEAMIKEAILAHPEEARTGLSRPTIKKFLHSKHPATSKVSETTFNSLISKALKKGAEKKTFVLPKGPSGKVKLSPAAKVAPKKKPAVKKPAVKKTVKKTAAKKKTTTAKKPAAKKTASSTTKKAKKPAAKKTAAAKPKKAVTKKAAAPKKA